MPTNSIAELRRSLTRPLLIASIALSHGSPLFAERIEDVRPASITEWVRQVNLKLDRSMAVEDTLTGLVIVTFRRGRDGYPTDVEMRDTSPVLAQAARETLRRARELPPLPFGVNPDQRIKVQLLFAGDEGKAVYLAKRHMLFGSANEANRRLDVALASAGAGIASTQ